MWKRSRASDLSQPLASQPHSSTYPESTDIPPLPSTHTCKQMNTLGITTPAHAIMYIHIGVEADMETKSHNRVPAVGSHKYLQAPTLFFPSVPTSISVG